MWQLVEDADKPPRSSRSHQTGLLSIAAFCGFICIGLCLCILYLFQLSSWNDDSDAVLKPSLPSVATPGPPTLQESLSHSKVEEDYGAILLHPEEHVRRQPKVIHLIWNITIESRSPDGVLKPVYLINGNFPGPTVEARPGDELIVDVYNGVTEKSQSAIAIHWHGLSMNDANHMDGVVGLTQCAIRKSQTFTYQFRIPDHQAGTFWYHAHSGLQRADGLFGAIIVHRPANVNALGDQDLYQYQSEQLLVIGDWYHRKAEEVLNWFVDPDHYGMEPAPDSLLINGRGRFNCSMAVKAYPIECHDVENPVIKLVNERRIRLRVVNVGVSAGFSLSVSEGNMELITMDGGYPVNDETASAKTIGLLYPGERIDLILDRTAGHSSSHQSSTRHKSSSNLSIKLDRENMPLWNFALTRTQSFEMQSYIAAEDSISRHSSKRETQVDVLNLDHVFGNSLPAHIAIEKPPSQLAVLYSTMKIRAADHNHPVGSINHTSWITSSTQTQPLLSLSREEWEAVVPQPTKVHKFEVPWFKESGSDKWIEIAVNNFDDRGHPFHLHGYEFFVVSRSQMLGTYKGYNPFDPNTKGVTEPLNTHNPMRRDTVYIPPMGYVVIRFPLNNDGLWLLHCHVLWHQAIGMGIVLQVGGIPETAKQMARQSCVESHSH